MDEFAHRGRGRRGAAWLAVWFAGASVTWGVGSGGFSNQVVGNAALGRGNTGVAWIEDATGLYMNPAAIGFLTGPDVRAGATFERVECEYRSSNGAVEQDMNTITEVVPHLYGAAPLGQGGWTLGVGLTVPYGLHSDWDETGFSRYVATESEASFTDVTPVIAFRPHPSLAVAAGLDLIWGDATLERQLNQAGITAMATGVQAPVPDGSAKMEGDGEGLGWNAGLLWQPAAGHRCGASYRSEADVDLDGDLRLGRLAGAPAALFGGTSFSTSASTEVSLPGEVTVGYAVDLGERWTIEADAAWVGWSSFDELGFDYGVAHPLLAAGNPIPKDWDDVWALGVGADYRWTSQWTARFGYYFYETPVPEATFDPIVPDADRHNVTVGVGYRAGAWSADAALVFVMGDEREVQSAAGAAVGTDLSGTYELQTILAGLTLGRRF